MLRGIAVVLRRRAFAFFALLALSALAFVAAAPDRRPSAPGPVVALFDAPGLTVTHDTETESAREPRGIDPRALRRSKTADPSRSIRAKEDGASAAFVASGGGALASRWPWACARPRASAVDRRGDDVRARSMVRLN